MQIDSTLMRDDSEEHKKRARGEAWTRASCAQVHFTSVCIFFSVVASLSSSLLFFFFILGFIDGPLRTSEGKYDRVVCCLGDSSLTPSMWSLPRASDPSRGRVYSMKTTYADPKKDYLYLIDDISFLGRPLCVRTRIWGERVRVAGWWVPEWGDHTPHLAFSLSYYVHVVIETTPFLILLAFLPFFGSAKDSRRFLDQYDNSFGFILNPS